MKKPTRKVEYLVYDVHDGNGQVFDSKKAAESHISDLLDEDMHEADILVFRGVRLDWRKNILINILDE